jgi:hypothetical protein
MPRATLLPFEKLSQRSSLRALKSRQEFDLKNAKKSFVFLNLC